MGNDELLLAISDMLDEKLEKGLRPVRNDIAGLKADVSELKTEVSQLKADVSELKTEVSQLKADVSELKTEVSQLKIDVSQLKTEMSQTKTKVSKLEIDIEVLKSDMLSVKNEQVRINFIIENEIRTDIRLLAENYMPAAKRYEKSMEQMEEMKSDIKMMKGVLAEHSEILQRFA